jgi:hypothetical protein
MGETADQSHVSEELYWKEVRSEAEQLVEAADEQVDTDELGDIEHMVVTMASHTLTGHPWFGKYEMDTPDFGAMVSYGDADPADYFDKWYGLTGSTYEQAVQEMAARQFEVDVIETAQEMIDDL